MRQPAQRIPLRRLIFTGLIVSLLSGAAWFFWPRKADLRAFDAQGMGRMEADMWRCYYNKRYLALGCDLWLTAYWQYGFSPWDSLQMARHAALAARAAQPTQSRTDAFAHALPDLKAYYQIIRDAAHVQASVEDLARSELNWWVLRREHVGWQAYGQAVADATAKLYGVPEPSIHASALLRAEMMDYRDERRDGKMKETDWQHIAKRLGESYSLLKQAVK